MQTEDEMQTGGELGIFYKFPPSHSHVIVLVDILMLIVEASQTRPQSLFEFQFYRGE